MREQIKHQHVRKEYFLLGNITVVITDDRIKIQNADHPNPHDDIVMTRTDAKDLLELLKYADGGLML